MPTRPPRFGSWNSREFFVVAGLTVLGALIRFWSFGRLGLVHFDEGIYALAGLWSLSPKGLAAIDPSVISYAPPGFPILVGLSYAVFGISDSAAILPSIVSGTLTIPVIAWIARRTFGRGAGGAAAAFAALSGPHIAFSRMALTDVSFLGVWLIAIGLGQRFLERPNAQRAVLFGGAVGLAQLFKYNGWTAGIIVAASALIWLSRHPGEWRSRTTAATWAWGVFSALVAAIVYYPWFRFVDAHGGYAALLAHQRSYLAGISAWPGHWQQQVVQSEFLSGGLVLRAFTGGAVICAILLSAGGTGLAERVRPRLIPAVAVAAMFCVSSQYNWCWSLGWIVIAIWARFDPENPARQLLFVAWGSLSCLTPFYHPYARLWLPLEALGWLLIAGMFVKMRSAIGPAGHTVSPPRGRAIDRQTWIAIASLTGALISCGVPWRKTTATVLAPSDSLKLATTQMMSEIPSGTPDLRIFARPPLVFYLGLTGRVSVNRQPDLNHLLEQGGARSWAVIDMGLLRQDGVSEARLERRLDGWTVVRKAETVLNPPTLLDIDPAAARADRADTSAPVWLLRRSGVEDGR